MNLYCRKMKNQVFGKDRKQSKEESVMKIFKKILPIVIIVVVAGLIYSFFHIDGREIKNVDGYIWQNHVWSIDGGSSFYFCFRGI